eukprot:Cvel_1319.t2-p1 / transcript=Cvel_1319.t2 / gene=Cvel_1319 / organism=Chromera_velia_CCMP2878 / gene_product=SUMO-activating enzyme subunit 2, putative / transcript_product=SUMO-activating enzyme subunit 2, putative / location=Cvel_scaffold45:29386-31976(-) / protein_length=153 / sequence_SO=supercontig / SO=protein_coding / is_pseudo=false
MQIVFDNLKDAKHEMDLVVAAANLWIWNYLIKRQIWWKCQKIVGNIIPAIASTNVAVAAFEVRKSVRLIYSLVEMLPDNFPADPSSYNVLEHYQQVLDRESERDRKKDTDILYPLLRGLWLVHDLWEDDKVLVGVFEVGKLDDPEEIKEEWER